MGQHDVRIETLGPDHAGELLTIRRAAFVTEAQQFNDPHIPALTQTLDELAEDLAADSTITLGAWQGSRLVGSIRVGIEGSKATIGRLAVAPDLQGQGIGTQLLLALTAHLPEDTTEIWVFTGKNSTHNLAMYNDASDELQFDDVAGDLTFAFFRKVLESGIVTDAPQN